MQAQLKIPEHYILPEHALQLRVQTKDKSKSPQIKFVNPNVDNYPDNIKNSARLQKEKEYRNAAKDSLKGKTVVILGSGNTLKDPKVLDDVKKYVDDGAILVACKQAIKFMHDQGFKIDYGVSMDPGDHIACPEKIYKAPNMTHIIASSSDPKLFEYLKGEKVQIFHSACGLIDEVKLYKELFEDNFVAVGGYNVINRALSIMWYMGASKIVMAGVDSGWRTGESFYVDNTNNRPGVNMTDKGRVDMTTDEQQRFAELETKQELSESEQNEMSGLTTMIWHTRPDMLASAVSLARDAKKHGEENFIFLGDTLPAKLRYRDEQFLNECVSIMNNK